MADIGFINDGATSTDNTTSYFNVFTNAGHTTSTLTTIDAASLSSLDFLFWNSPNESTPLSAAEINALRDFVLAGGRLMIVTDPAASTNDAAHASYINSVLTTIGADISISSSQYSGPLNNDTSHPLFSGVSSLTTGTFDFTVTASGDAQVLRGDLTGSTGQLVVDEVGTNGGGVFVWGDFDSASPINANFLSNTTSVSLDPGETTPPTVTSVVLSDTDIVQTDIGTSVTLTITFSEGMNTGVAPTIVTNAGTTLISSGGTWLLPTSYRATYLLADANAEIANVTFDISGAEDAAGNVMAAVTGVSSSPAASIDTAAPTVTSVTVSDTAITEADAGGPVFTVAVVYDSLMDESGANNPAIAFAPTPGGLTFQSGAWTDDGSVSTYTASYTVSDADAENSDVDITVTGAQDLAGNVQQSFTATDAFSEDTVAPTASISLSGNNIGIGETSTVTITFSEAVTSFDNTDVTAPNGSLSAFTTGDDGITWTATFTPDPATEADTNVISLAATYTDLLGNPGTAATSANYIVDTVAPASLASTTTTIDENPSVALVLDTFSNDDAGPGGLTYTLATNPGSAFELFVNGSNTELHVLDPAYFDYEDRTSIDVDITATDAAGNATTTTYTVNLNDINDAPQLVGTPDDAGAVTEGTLPYSDTGTLDFQDDDIGDIHSVNTAAGGGGVGYLGSFNAGLSNSATPDGEGTVTWTFNITDAGEIADIENLREGETITQTYTITIADRASPLDPEYQSVEQVVTVTITGTNDQPVIEGTSTLTDTLTETAATTGSATVLDATGTIDFSDIDDTTNAVSLQSDTHTPNSTFVNAVWTPDGGSALILGEIGGLVFGAVDQSGNSVDWTYSVTDSDLDFLGENDQLVITYDVTISDDSGATDSDSVSQQVVVTITGTNDDPAIAVVTNPAALVEVAGDSSAQDLSAAGSLTVDDEDHGDTLTGAVVGDAVATLNGTTDLSADPRVAALIANAALTFDATATSDGTTQPLNYTYAVTGADLDFLRAGDTLTLDYTVNVGDGTSTSGTDTVTVTITGTNDDPTVTAALIGSDNDRNDSDASNIEGAGTLPQTFNLLDGAADLDDGETALLAVTNVAVMPSNGARSFTVGGPGSDFVIDASGVLTFDASLFQDLYDGQSETITFNYDIEDPQGATVAQSCSPSALTGQTELIA